MRWLWDSGWLATEIKCCSGRGAPWGTVFYWATKWLQMSSLSKNVIHWKKRASQKDAKEDPRTLKLYLSRGPNMHFGPGPIFWLCSDPSLLNPMSTCGLRCSGKTVISHTIGTMICLQFAGFIARFISIVIKSEIMIIRDCESRVDCQLTHRRESFLTFGSDDGWVHQKLHFKMIATKHLGSIHWYRWSPTKFLEAKSRVEKYSRLKSFGTAISSGTLRVEIFQAGCRYSSFRVNLCIIHSLLQISGIHR